MHMSKSLLKMFNTIFPFLDFIYIAQLEEYSTSRYFYHLKRFFWRRNFQNRQKLILTKRAKNILILSIILYLPFFFLPPIIPLVVGASNYLWEAFYQRGRNKFYEKARKKIQENQGMKIIAIAGSFGKTTTKYFTYELIRFNYKVQMIEKNINTPIGIAVWVINNLKQDTEILLLECDAYSYEEMQNTMNIIEPNIAVVTNVGDQHIERFGSSDNLAKTLALFFEKCANNAVLLSDATTKNILQKYTKRQIKVVNTKKEFSKLNISSSAKINLNFAIAIAEILNTPKRYINDTIKDLKSPDRRGNISEIFGYSGIDESYNVSFTTAQASLEYAKIKAKQLNKKLLVVTAGIPELGKDDQDKNQKYGQLLSKGSDFTIILNSIFADELKEGFADNKNYKIIKALSELPDFLKDFSKNDWFILMEPELNDLYYSQ